MMKRMAMILRMKMRLSDLILNVFFSITVRRLSLRPKPCTENKGKRDVDSNKK